MNYGKKGVRKRQRDLNSKSVKVKKMLTVNAFKAILTVVIGVSIIGLSLGLGVFKGIISSVPDISNISVSPTGFSTFVYDNEGHETAKLVSSDSNRIPVSMDKIPENLAHAFVAIEDERFYEHNGIDIQGIMRAAVKGIRTKNFSEGASTITQQLLKNNVFKGWVDENSFAEKVKRKIQEQYLALELEKIMSKDEILENYMNTINLGQSTLGVQAASLRYFDKQVYDLNLSECAVIASITQNPSKYNPISHPDQNAVRREKVLGNMLTQGYITQEEYDEAITDDVYSRIQTVNLETDTDSVYTYFVDELTEQVLQDLIDIKGYNETQAYTALYSGGLSIYTTQDPQIQSICNEVFNSEESYPENVKWYLTYALTIERANGEIENISSEIFKAYYQQQNPNFDMLYATKDDANAAIESYKETNLASGDTVIAEDISMTPQPQVSLTIEDQSTGQIVAMIGGRGAKEGSRTLNRASNTTRQPGSTFKVVSTYAPALDSAGLTLATVFTDSPYNYANGRPVANWYGDSYKGICSLRYGIEQSLNIIAVKTLTTITPQLGFDYLENFGFSTLVARREESNGTIVSDIGQPLALGGITDGVTNMELNAAYATIANGGTYVKPTLYTKIVDHDGNVLIDNTKPESRQVIKETTAFLLTDAMVDVVTKGTGASVNFGNMSMAGKTGTTSDYKDVWFSGYTPYYTATTWAGYDNNTSLSGSGEKNLAKTLWRSVMAKIHEELPNESFDVPAGIVTATVCSKSGKLPIAGLCDSTLTKEYFAEGTVPTESCDVHYQGGICVYSGLPASDLCPFKVDGVLELNPPADTALSGTVSSTIDPVTGLATQTTQRCPHDATFFADPNAPLIIEQQRAEMVQRKAATDAAAAAAAAAAVPTP
ncbi:MAG: PBP1A family penicillin-binding protein [Lachnospiraceae bacterium]|nr:PBP1A family penicillin-binding protein [Lachnospiraceae bacterium]MDD3660328.1 PBP1A family penicillin-binding protein [Lachnospiraceae bacterium]